MVPTVLILDASGSMTETDAPGSRIDAAKAAAHGLLDGLPDQAPIALQTYGTSTGSADEDKPASCQDVTIVIPLGPLDRTAMSNAVDAIRPSGYTPISLALRAAAEQLPANDAAQAIVLVSDGEDTCDIPPCEAAAALKISHPGLTISTVGFKVDGPAADQLRCIADTTGGLFVQAANADQLAARLKATQDIDQANQSLSDSGIFGIGLGSSIGDIRTAHPDFPEASATGSVTVIWRDCDFSFLDGNLDSVAPHTNARTVDGVTVGEAVDRAGQLYGPPLLATGNTDGTSTVIFDANPNTDAAYRMSIDDFTDTNGTLTGTIKSIVLCLCKPTAASSGVTLGPNSLLTFGGAGGVYVGDHASKIPDTYIDKWTSDGMGTIPAGFSLYHFRTPEAPYKSEAFIRVDDAGMIYEFTWFGTERGVTLESSESEVEAAYLGQPRGQCRLPGWNWYGTFYRAEATGRFVLFVYDDTHKLQTIKAVMDVRDGEQCGFE